MAGMHRSVRWVVCGFSASVPAMSLTLGLLPFSEAFAGKGTVHINEIRIDQPGTDNDEYFELIGPPGSSLSGLTYIVIGDNAAAQGSGVIEVVVNLNGQSIGPSGYFLAAEPTFTLGAANFVANLNFENDDNVTHMLVSGFTGAQNLDLDTNDDGVLDNMPWASVLDVIAVIKSPNPPAGTEWHYGPPSIGPEGVFVPGHVGRSDECFEWELLSFEVVGGNDSPGAPNPLCEPTEQYFFGLKHAPLGNVALVGDSDGDLLISNIGSSGQDGVSVRVADLKCSGCISNGWQGVMDFGQVGALPTGSHLTIRVQEDDLQDLYTVTISEANGGQGAVSFAQDVCDPCSITVQLRNHGAVVDTMTYLPPYPPEVAIGNIGSSGQDGVAFAAGPRQTTSQDGTFSHSAHIRQSLSAPIRLTASPTGPVDTDEIVMRLNGLPPGTRYIGGLDLTAANTGPITVSSESLLAHELVHTVQQSSGTPNNARIIGVGDVDGDGQADLSVSNIGSSGQDGVRIRGGGFGNNPNNLCAVAVEANWGGAGALPSGSNMRWIVDAEGPVVTLQYELAVTETGGGHASVSFIPCKDPGCCQPCCPCAGVVVEALYYGMLVDQVVHDALPTTIASGNIGSSGQDGVSFSAAMIDSCVNIADDRYLLGLKQYDPTLMTLTGSSVGSVTANEIRVYVTTPASSYMGLSGASLRAANVSSFDILDGDSSPLYVPDLSFGGLPHMALGQAELSVGADGSLIVRGDWDGDGEDTLGAAISVGQASGWAGELDFGPAGGMPPGSGVALKGKSLNLTDVIVFEADGGLSAISYQQEICNPCETRVQLFDCDGTQVGEATMPGSFAGPLVRGAIGSSDGEGVKVVVDRDSGRSRIHNPVTTPMMLPGQAPVDAATIVISLNGLPPGEPVEGMTMLDINYTNLPQLALSNERVVLFGGLHEAMGQASMCASRDNHLQGGIDVMQALRISNIGSSGQDGVSITDVSARGDDRDCDDTSDDLEELSVQYQPLTLPQGGKHAINTKGTGAQGGLAGTPAFFDVFMEIECIDGKNDNITADFSSVGSRTHTVQVYNDGALVSSLSGVGSLVATIPAGQALEAIDASRSTDDELVKTWTWTQIDGPFAFSIPGQAPVLGDELRVKGDSPTLDNIIISSMLITAANLTGGELTIIGEVTVPTPTVNPCPADINNTGAVDVDDLLGVINGWGQCNPGGACVADIVPAGGNGMIDVDDLLAVINAWGPCP